MNELTEFKWINTSLTTVSQSKFISKLAKHFNIPVKTLRNDLNKDQLTKAQVICFNHNNVAIDEGFYIANFKINVNELINPGKFINSRFLNEYTVMDSLEDRIGATFVIYSASFHIVCDMNDLDFNRLGGGGIFFNYPPTFIEKVIVPLQTYLDNRYPTPSY